MIEVMAAGLGVTRIMIPLVFDSIDMSNGTVSTGYVCVH
jgi:hypothetical protein